MENENEINGSGLESDGAAEGNDSTGNGLWPDDADRSKEPFVFDNASFSSDSKEQSIRKSGLAWSAGIVLFTSIAFMLFLGWIADLLLGSSPWGVVGGIVIGSILGFFQFFRISSQIFAKKDVSSSAKTLFRDDDQK